MPKYKLRNVYKTLLQIWLFYYFLSMQVHECQEVNDVEFISSTKHEKNEDSEFNRPESIDNEFLYEPIEPNHRSEFNQLDEIDDTKNVDLNVNNNLPHESETPNEEGEVPSRYTEITEREITGEKILYSSDSPYLLRQDLEIQQHAKLIVEPGVTVHFAPMVGITIRGQIKAIVSTKTNSLRMTQSSVSKHALVARILSEVITEICLHYGKCSEMCVIGCALSSSELNLVFASTPCTIRSNLESL